MKKIWLIITVILIMMAMTAFGLSYWQKNQTYQQDGIETYALIREGDFYIYRNNSMEKVFIKGVNIGATKPGYFPGELGITKEDYLRWFRYISEMNANTVRVYTTMKPAFYDALYEFNTKNKNKIYVMHGVWLNEDLIKIIQDPYLEDQRLFKEFIQDGKDLVDIFHGNKILNQRTGFASGTYTKDVSPYIIAWILGIEWSPEFVTSTNQKNSADTLFEGEFIYTEGASPFEIFLARVGDALLKYEAETYKMTRPISYTNWLTTDPLEHLNEPDFKEDMVSVNVEHIKLTNQAFAGQFASYHIYPYYPEFMNFSEEYISAYDPINTYKAYLEDLNAFHTMPILVAEFGVPASRGKAHDARYSGFNQGNHTEKEQGEILSSLIQDIHDSNYLGALIFSFQDEWFKRTWNTMDFDLDWQRPFWSNVETNEQMFGLLSFEPGTSLKIKLDGDLSDWNDIPYINSGGLNLKATQDERYLYLMVEFDLSQSNQQLYIGIDTIPDQGNLSSFDNHLTLSGGADFLITIGETARMQVDPYYDAFSHLYSNVLNMVEPPIGMLVKNSGLFTNMYHALSKKLTIPGTLEQIPFSKYEAGLLRSGISDPNHDDYDSLSDYYLSSTFVEIRIPYLLLNIMDPSTKTIISDFKGQTSFTAESIDTIYIGAGFGSSHIALSPYTLMEWEMPTYHERLKQSYDIIKETFKNLN